MTMCLVNNCCCGCTLRTGAFIIGWVDLVLGVLKSFWNTYQIAHRCSVCWGFATINFITVPLAVCLLVGTLKEKTSLLWTWVFIWWLLIPIAGVLYIIIIIEAMYTSFSASIAADVIIFFEIYYNIVVRSYVISIKDQHDGMGIGA